MSVLLSIRSPRFRGGKQRERDRWYGLENESDFDIFRRWWHRDRKKHYSGNIDSAEEAREIYDEWAKSGRPKRLEAGLTMATPKVTRDRAPLTDQEAATIADLERLAEHGATARERQQIIDIAEKTNSAAVRDAAALAMADLRIEGATKILVRLISNSETEKHRGTLLYALDELNGSLPVSLVADLLLKENYEVREETLIIVGKGHVEGTLAERKEALSALQALAESSDEYVAAVGDRAISWLRPSKQRSIRHKATAVR